LRRNKESVAVVLWAMVLGRLTRVDGDAIVA